MSWITLPSWSAESGSSASGSCSARPVCGDGMTSGKYISPAPGTSFRAGMFLYRSRASSSSRFSSASFGSGRAGSPPLAGTGFCRAVRHFHRAGKGRYRGSLARAHVQGTGFTLAGSDSVQAMTRAKSSKWRIRMVSHHRRNPDRCLVRTAPPVAGTVPGLPGDSQAGSPGCRCACGCRRALLNVQATAAPQSSIWTVESFAG